MAAVRPEWEYLDVVSTPDQTTEMRVTGQRRVGGIVATLVYGAGGLELWARHRNGTVVPVLALAWAQVVDIVGTDVSDWRGYQRRGLRITLTDGRREDLVVPPVLAEVRAARGSGTPWNVVVASRILAAHTAVTPQGPTTLP
ncbi:hypothetical protein [Cellulomonas sp. URHD0024]|uniref:hypothetical protein n=1 Tax=Cellulomonas sp. URHD0024 TaxID=1302620 RepID=UPI000418EBE3|nr:hypothetical protein [Cellulomonas sp. URHD0024]